MSGRPLSDGRVHGVSLQASPTRGGALRADDVLREEGQIGDNRRTMVCEKKNIPDGLGPVPNCSGNDFPGPWHP